MQRQGVDLISENHWYTSSYNVTDAILESSNFYSNHDHYCNEPASSESED